MITIDWSFVGGVALVVLGGIGSIAALFKHVPKASVPQAVSKVAPKAASTARSADAAAPAGAVEWVLDVVAAMSEAEAGTVLESLKIGESRDEARTRRIAELESAVAKAKEGGA